MMYHRLVKSRGQFVDLQACCGCLEGQVCMGVHAQFLAYNSNATRLFIALSMQMDREFEKEQIGTLFVWVGALEDGVGGGEVRGVWPRILT
eukprot:1138993-Pelagomonas_calceolata.AAC.1